MTAETSWREERVLVTFARNVASRYVLIIVNALIGLMVLPYNLSHLGKAAYGLWMLTRARAWRPVRWARQLRASSRIHLRSSGRIRNGLLRTIPE